MIIRLLLQIVGFMLFLSGIVLTVSPIPFSFTIMVIGAMLIIANNHSIAAWVRSLRVRWPAFDRAFVWAEHFLPKRWRVDSESVFDDCKNSPRERD